MTTAAAAVLDNPPVLETTQQLNTTLFDDRKMTSKDGMEYDFKVLVVDSPDKWKAASELKHDFSMPLPGSQTSIKFPMQGISYSQWEDTERNTLLPEAEINEETNKPIVTAEFTNERERMISLRRLRLLEISVGCSIPGATDDDKIDWLQERSNGDIEALHTVINSVVGGMNDGPILTRYQTVSRSSSEGNVIAFKSFDDWTVASESSCYFRVQHYMEDFITEFPLRNIPKKLKMEIDEQTKDPEPPKIMKRDSAGKLDFKSFEFNFRDPHYIKKSIAVQHKRMVMLCEATLMFELPGSSMQDKWNWLSSRLFGDVHRLETFISDSILGVGSRFNFF